MLQSEAFQLMITFRTCLAAQVALFGVV